MKDQEFDQFLGALSETKFFGEILNKSRTEHALSIKTLSGSLRSALIAALWNKQPQRTCIIAENKAEAQQYLHDLELLIGEENVALFSEPEKHLRISSEQLDAKVLSVVESLSVLDRSEHAVAILTPEIFLFDVPTPNQVQSHHLHLMRGDQTDFEEFVTQLALHGFDRKDFVANTGDYSVRGGIIDIFPIGWDNPIRLEFFGNEIDSIREFDPLSQRSIREHKEAEFIANMFAAEENFSKTDILSYFPEDSLFVLDSPEALEQRFSELEAPETFPALKKYRHILLNGFGEAHVAVKSSLQPKFQSSIEKFTHELRLLAAQKHEIFLCAEGNIHTKRFQELIFNALDGEITHSEEGEKLASEKETLKQVRWVHETLSQGFFLPDDKLAVLTEHQLFERMRVQVNRKKKQKTGITLRELGQLKRGDYVVHEDKGIGKFEGLETVTIGEVKTEAVRLSFAGGDTLYVNLNFINKLQKYASEEGAVPKLSKLGTSEWERKKAKTKKRLKDIARDLIRLYAARKAQRGFPFPVDNIWQKEFEASFIYEDTPDQARATAEVKTDMQEPIPMDRLVCGDVGFGKTEVAIRAAFKAVQAGKQVAVLVPTTILAQQHFLTFKDRLHRYPVVVEVISRFRTKAEQTNILERLGKGQVDILIGTHRLLSKDVKFKDLGLLVIDEEHRFGVGAKEKLRQLRVEVDTLTLTATPIPRTLNFSLMGARDLSVIETPPRNRLPIDTEILQWDDEILREAIVRELDRGGQMFMVNDRISDLDDLARKLKMLVPNLRTCIAHGQMTGEELENVMEKFLERKFDILIATKIIESGIDIPNANTMFVNRADNFGLAELYQIRGRVGRSNTQAFCYLIIPPVHAISRVALRRLQALEEHTDLGSGFKLAMRDMEIRGAGNLLGGEQSGFIMEMGFEMYQKILDEAVQELRSEEFSELFKDEPKPKETFINEDIAIDLESDALIPGDYIHADTERYEFYKRLYHAHDETVLHKISDEMRDRYGAFPHQVENLIFAIRMRIAAMPTGMTRITLKHGRMSLELPPEENVRFYEKAFQPLVAQVGTIPGAKLEQLKKKIVVRMPVSSREQGLSIMKRLSDAVLNRESVAV